MDIIPDHLVRCTKGLELSPQRNGLVLKPTYVALERTPNISNASKIGR